MPNRSSSLSASEGYAKAIAAARSGDNSGLEQLSSILRTDFGLRHTLEALEIYLSFLDSSLIPSFIAFRLRNPEAFANASRAFKSLMGLQNVLDNGNDSDLPGVERLSEELAANLVQKLDHVVAWYGFFLNPLSYIHPSAPLGARKTVVLDQFTMFLYKIGNFLPILDNAAWQNNAIQDLIVDIWLFQNGDMDPLDLTYLSGFKKADYFLNIVEHAPQIGLLHCSIPAIMQQALLHASARPIMMEKLFRRFESDRNGPTDSHVQLAKSILSRIGQIQSRVECGQYPAAYAFESLAFLCNIIKTLTGWAEGDTVLTVASTYDPLAPHVDCRKLYHSLYKAGYTAIVTTALLSISRKAITEEKPVPPTNSDPPTAFIAATIVTGFLIPKLYPEPVSHLKWRFHAMINNGVLEVIANAAPIWHESHPSFRMAQAHHRFDSIIVFESLLSFCVNATCHPSLVHATHRAFHGLSQEHWNYLSLSCMAVAGEVQEHYPNSDIHHDWAAEFKRQSSQWLVLFTQFRSSWRRMLCDSETHHQDRDSGPQSQRQVRRCMGCSLAVYCSTKCQKADWERRHRHECHSKRQPPRSPRDREMDTTLTCNPRTRAWHIHFLQNFVQNGGWAEIILESDGSLEESSIVRVNFNSLPTTVETIDLEDYQPRHFSMDDALEDNFRRHFLLWNPPQMVERQDGARIHFHLVEGVFGFGSPNILALIMLKLCICEHPAGSDDTITTVCMDSITRIG
ncbi:hypothetical protein BKA70DRAFT_1446761 [Coprinopsis sp. MPI-PUGE-AT-0042]|nr:hypothetical protein BKA70DRAFT_1446761 [Coprinopsis sp. MPI-PUGE-AT-0042]